MCYILAIGISIIQCPNIQSAKQSIDHNLIFSVVGDLPLIKNTTCLVLWHFLVCLFLFTPVNILKCFILKDISDILYVAEVWCYFGC